MKSRYLLFFLLLVTSQLAAQQINLDSIYHSVDEAIASAPSFVNMKKENIKRITDELRTVRQPSDSLRVCRQLYQEYAAFRNDSALHFIMLCIDIAERLGEKNSADECRAIAALQCSNTGLYSEAQSLLDGIDKLNASQPTTNKYLLAASHLYGELGFYSPISRFRNSYYATQARFNDDIYRTFPTDDDAYLQRKEMECYNARDFKQALLYNDKRIHGLSDNARQFAVAAFYRYLDYKLTPDSVMQRYWLCKAVICDIQNAVMDQGALWELANQLQNDGDVERSHRYIQFAWQCAMTFGTRVRNQQITPVLSHIDGMVQTEQKRINERQRIVLTILGVLAGTLILLIHNMWKQHKRLARTQDELRHTNEQLVLLNQDMHNANAQLNDAIMLQERLNAELAHANKLKEEYVGHFMRLCSQYIDRSDNFRKHVNKLLKLRDFDRLQAETSSKSIQETDIKELYESFDSTFLHIFPNFLRDFNALLRPEEQQEMDGDHLTTQLRIFALIRLGIDESAKIAEFLHYSVNTIYNYRAKIKNSAIDRENFEQHVKNI